MCISVHWSKRDRVLAIVSVYDSGGRACDQIHWTTGTGCGKQCPLKASTTFVAISANFEARFYTFITYAKGHFIIYNYDKVIGTISSFLAFIYSRMCAERKRHHVFAAENIIIRTTQQTVCQWLRTRSVHSQPSHNHAFEFFNSLVDRSLWQVTPDHPPRLLEFNDGFRFLLAYWLFL